MNALNAKMVSRSRLVEYNVFDGTTTTSSNYTTTLPKPDN